MVDAPVSGGTIGKPALLQHSRPKLVGAAPCNPGLGHTAAWDYASGRSNPAQPSLHTRRMHVRLCVRPCACARACVRVCVWHTSGRMSACISGAENATLTFMVGGSDGDYERAHSILSKMGKNIVHCGDAGTGLTPARAQRLAT